MLNSLVGNLENGIILLNNTSNILTQEEKINIGRKNNKKKNEKNNKQKKSNFADETERIIKTTAKLIKIKLKFLEGITNTIQVLKILKIKVFHL